MGNSVSLRQNTSVEIVRHRLFAGYQSRIARSLGISRSVVCRVANGKKTSRRVAAAIAKEIARIERHVARQNGRAA